MVDSSTTALISKMVRQRRHTLLKQHEELIGPIHKRTHKKVLWFRLSYFVQVKYYKENKLLIPERIQKKYDKAMRCFLYKDLYKWGLVNTMAEKYDDKTGQIISECPEFCRGWDVEESCCKECFALFNEEYHACMKYCKSKKAFESANAGKIFYVFRKGSKADFILGILQTHNTICYDDLVRMVNDRYVLGIRNAGYLVTNYINQWSRGVWANKPVTLDFDIAISKDIIKYRKKVYE